MKIFFGLILFFLCNFSSILFSYKISKKLLNIENNLVLFLSVLILNLVLLISGANFLLFIKLYNLFYFSIFTIPLGIFSLKEIKSLKIQKITLKLPFFYKILFFIFIFSLFFIFFEGLITPPLSWDSLEYHMFQSAVYVQKGFFSNLNFEGLISTFAEHPKNYEIFLSLFLLFFKSDFLGNICNFYFLILLIISSLIFLKYFRLNERRTFFFIINIGTIPAFFIYLPTQYIDLACFCLLFCGMTFLKVYEEEKKEYFLFFSSICFALALSFKIYNLAPFILSHIFIFYLFCKNKRIKSFAFLIIIAFNLIFLNHYIRIFYKYQNPIYPFPLKIFGKDIGRSDPRILNYFNEINEKQKQWASEKHKYLKPFEKKLAPYLYTISTIFSQKHQTLGRQAFLYVLFGLISLVFLKDSFWQIFFLSQILAFLFQFFSPSLEPMRILFSISYSRYLIFVISIFAFLSLKLLENNKIYEILFIFNFISNIFLIIPEILLPIHIKLASFSFIFSLIFYTLFFKNPKIFLILFFVIFALFSPLVSNIKESNRLYFYLNYYHVSTISKAVFPVSTILNGKNARISCYIKEGPFDKNVLFFYPLIGKDFENEILYIDPARKKFEEWIENLKKERIDFILFNKNALENFKWSLEDKDIFKLIYQDETVYLYSFIPK